MSTGALLDRAPRQIGIRPATDADLPFVAAIINTQIETSPFIWTDVPKTLDERRVWFRAHAAANQPVIVATSGADVVGWSSLSAFRSGSGYRFTAEVSVYVDAACHRQGIGSRLLAAIETEARARSLHALVAVIDDAHMASIGLFANAGFREAGRLPELGWKFGTWRGEVFLVKLLA